MKSSEANQTAQTEIFSPSRKDLVARIHASLEAARREMLETGKRNRLINTPRKKAKSKSLEIIDEVSEEVFKLLVRDRKSMSFTANPKRKAKEDEAEAAVYVPASQELDDDGKASRHKDNNLQTDLSPESLQTRLLSIYRDGRTIEEEQGINVLYLALGFVKWFESPSSDVEHWAPLILVPVELDRKNIKGRFNLSYRDEDMSANLSFQEMLRELEITLPELPDDDDWKASKYFAQVKECIGDKPKWEVDENAIVLGFFSFSKFLMFKDLELESWPENTIEKHPILAPLLGDGFPQDSPFFTDESRLDEELDPAELIHILDADSSQTQVIESVKRGKSLVVQGPPGTGKSQTIANIIGAAVHSGKTVLFVAEKMTALNVVYNRLAKQQLGDLCLELHSRKSNKLAIIENLKNTLHAGAARFPANAAINRLRQTRDELNQIDKVLHTPLEPSGRTPYWALGELVSLQQSGMAPPALQLEKAAQWTNEEVVTLQRALERLIQAMETAGPKDSHPWRGVRVQLTPMEINRLKPIIAAYQKAINDVFEIVTLVERELTISHEWKLGETEFLQQILEQLSKRSRASQELFEKLAECDPKRATKLLSSAQKLLTLSEEVNIIFIDSAWDNDVSSIRKNIAAYGNSVFKIFNKEFREASAQLRGLLRAPKLPAVNEQISLLDKLTEAQKLKKDLKEQDVLGLEYFGSHWLGDKSDFGLLTEVLTWVLDVRNLSNQTVNLQRILSLPFEPDKLNVWAKQLSAGAEESLKGLNVVGKILDFDFALILGFSNCEQAAIKTLNQIGNLWISEFTRLDEWNQLCLTDKNLRDCGGDFVADLLGNNQLQPAEAKDFVRYIRAEALWKQAIKVMPELATIDGTERSRLVEEFKELDIRRQTLAMQEIAAKHSLTMPKGNSGDMGVIWGEVAKKRNLMPVRKLIAKAGIGIQKIKPVFMMSPLSVAQFLPRTNLTFDILLIDEASQVKPADAFGAILRAKQIVVVGDSKQLPPTSFFEAATSADDSSLYENEDEDVTPTTKTTEVESILKLCESKQIFSMDLRWHYRSKHPSLIQVSNQEFYKNLLLVPSPYMTTGVLGLSVCKVDGVYGRGDTQTNTIEAEAVAKAVIEHFRTHPDKSLGVAALSTKQRDEINRVLDYERAKNPELEAYFSHASTQAEPFFVKNLESVQGDERDVIFVSIGYGPVIAGSRLQYMGFGPVTQEGGERRLNVLFTRAKERCVIFCSFHSAEIDPAKSSKAGLGILKTYLRYAESGILDVPLATGDDFDSPFEEAVAKAITQLGYDVDAQVGSAGFKIDLAVKHPDNPGHYMLAIECDGAAYHTSLWARDRDRLRQAVLESQGWHFHRIWSTDWFRQPEKALLALRTKLEEAKERGFTRTPQPISYNAPLFNTTLPPMIEREEISATLDTREISYYQEADVAVPSHLEPHRVDIFTMANIVTGIVEVEGPIHEDEVARRVTRLFGLQRSGARINETVISALRKAKRDGNLSGEKGFWSHTNSELKAIRNRSKVTSSELWKPEMLPPAEIQKGILSTVELNFGISEDKLCMEISRLFGFKKTSSQLKEVFVNHIKKMAESNSIKHTDGKFYLPDEA